MAARFVTFERDGDSKPVLINAEQVRCVTSEEPGVCRIYFDDSAKAMPVKGTLAEVENSLIWVGLP